MPWQPENDPEWSIKTLNSLAEQSCARFQELVEKANNNSGSGPIYCGQCDSCVCSQALILVKRERARKSVEK